MARKLLLATRNPHKKKELQRILGDLSIEILTLEEVKDLPEVEENGKTFAENALKKAVAGASASGLICLADDSGLEVDALDGKPGVYSARFAGEYADDQQNNEKLLQMMQGIEEKKRTARFVCAIAVSDPQGRAKVVKGVCEGKIAFAPVGQGGFGYDPLFIPDGFFESFAELSAEEKNRISHRGMALKKAKPIIKKYFAE